MRHGRAHSIELEPEKKSRWTPPRDLDPYTRDEGCGNQCRIQCLLQPKGEGGSFVNCKELSKNQTQNPFEG